ncbi:MAG: helix-turn-helix domain-containing protein [Reyranella sp.]|jgi:Cu(I)-responsive transcriptional regulator|nr:helix-turn-helix domain-containing protein [Reyranella sp.]
MTVPSGFDLTIGSLAKRTGVKVQTIRYYETIGLLPSPDRTEGNQRRYNDRAAGTLRFIRHARDLGFEIDQIRGLLSLAAHPDRPCADADAIASHHLKQVEQRIAILQALRGELKRMVRQCSGGRVATCRVIEVLADHAHCQTEHRRAASGGMAR